MLDNVSPMPDSSDPQSTFSRAPRPSAPKSQGRSLPSPPRRESPRPPKSLEIQDSSSSFSCTSASPFSPCSLIILIMYSSMLSRSELFLDDSMVAFLTSSASSEVNEPLAEPIAEIPLTIAFAKSSASVISTASNSFLESFFPGLGPLLSSGDPSFILLLIGLVP